MALCVTLVPPVLAAPASAKTTWSGSCTFKGWSEFWPNRRWVPVPAGAHYVGNGHCKGTLNGKPFDGRARIDTYADMKQPMGCAVGGSTYGGPVYITFGGTAPAEPTHRNDGEAPTPPPPAPTSEHPILEAWSDEVNVGNNIYSDLWGAYRGFAVGYGGFPTDPDDVRKCGEEGVAGGELTQTYKTITELHG